MSYRRFAIILTAFICILQGISTAAPRIDPQDQKNIMLLKDVRPGMKGYGLSVFRGVKPERFQVQVLGVLKKFYFGSDLVLVKLAGGPMTSRGANLIEGMSGSPIFINGKILGAGNLTMPVHVKANAFSESAKAKIEKAGGKIELKGSKLQKEVSN